MPEPALTEILAFALELAADSGRFILPLWKNVAVGQKADGSEVTEADRGAEELLRRRIAQRYPDHAILGEEFGGERRRDAAHLWLLDPIDGTASFAIGLPLFGTLIGYARRRPVRRSDRGAGARRDCVRGDRAGLLVPARRQRSASRADLGCHGSDRGVRRGDRIREY